MHQNNMAMAIITAAAQCWRATWITAFYLALVAVWILGCLTLLPVLMLLNFILSCLIIVQGLVPFGLGRPLTRFTSTIQKPIQSTLFFWFFLFHLPIVFPLSMVLVFAPSMLAESLQGASRVLLPRVAFLLSRLCGIELPEAVSTLPKLIVWMSRYTSNLVTLRARSYTTASKTTLLKSATVQRLSLTCSTRLWRAYNSRSADWVAICFISVRTFVLRLLQLAQSGFYVLLVAAGLQFGDESVIILMYMSYLLVPVALFVSAFYDAAQELDQTELSAAQKANADIYGSLPIGSDAKSGSNFPTSTIRLLEIHPGHVELPIFCTLKIANLSGAETCSYEALSYCWGPIDTSQVIYINQQGFRVSAALFRAIHHLRPREKSRTVWIDAICVNQSDLVERSSQVLLMQQIYSKAASVIVWLGKPVQGLSRTFSDVRKESGDPYSHAINHNAVHYGATRVISCLLSRPWWTRVWVVQELASAKKACIRCDGDEITWEHFCLLVDRCVSMPYFQTKHINYQDFLAIRGLREERLSTARSSSRKEESSLGRLELQPNHSYDLLTMIYNFRAREATNPLDKVFAFQGLTGDTSSISRETRDYQSLSRVLVYPDYMRRASFLSIDLAKAHIRSTRTLSIIALAEFARQSDPRKPDNTNTNRQDYIPSWCPAFMNKESVREGLQLRPLWSGLPLSDYPDFAASDQLTIRDPNFNSKFSIPSPDRGYSYQLPVHIFPHLSLTIKEVGPAAGISLGNLGSMTKLVLMRRESTIAPSFRSSLSWESALPSWRKLARKGYRVRNTGTEHQSTNDGSIPFEELFNLTITGGKFACVSQPFVSKSEPERDDIGIGATAGQAAPNPNPHTRPQLYDRTRADTCIGRRFFITDSGHMGLGPASLAVGDEVHVILGLQIPAILRKASRDSDRGMDYCGASDNDWLYVGQAYVHELMIYKGVLEDDIQTGKVQVQEVLLV
ncbi:heterokaryon incompatibility protein-domain-containing protein [Xylaria flabelliformis]|nr:heterokaryon incompatibility protein-domain-containing protein [Xylaria flabelliformis]